MVKERQSSRMLLPKIKTYMSSDKQVFKTITGIKSKAIKGLIKTNTRRLKFQNSLLATQAEELYMLLKLHWWNLQEPFHP